MAKKQETVLGAFVGRPPHYETPIDLWNKAEEYFISTLTTSNRLRATITGVTNYVGFKSRASWDDYAKRSDEFSYTVSRIKMKVAEAYERNLHDHVWAGASFALRNMDGGNWKEETHQNVNQTVTEVKPQVVTSGPDLASNENEIKE